MTEVCFDASPCASLKQLKAEGQLSLGNQIIFYPDNLSIGSLQSLVPEHRLSELSKYGVSTDCSFYQLANDFVYLVKSEHVLRLWVSDSAHELIGLYFVCSIARGVTIKLCKLSSIGNPCLKCTTELSREQWITLQQNEKTVLIKDYAPLWDQLVKADGPLRISHCGEIISVGLDYFDKSICSAMSKYNDKYDIAEAVINEYIESGSGLFSIEYILNRVEHLQT